MKVRSRAMVWFLILFICTAILALAIPPSPQTLHNLHLTDHFYRILILTLLLPYGIIWFAAFYGYDQLQRYARALPNAAEGRAFKKIANGVQVFAWGMILTTLLSLALSLIRNRYPSFVSWQAIINHYAVLALALVAFTLIGDGTYKLFELVKGKRTKASTRWLVLIASFVGIMFVRLVAINRTANNNPYYLDIVTLLFTIVAPYIYAWTIGAIAVTELQQYTKYVSGVLYRKALQSLTNGLIIVIVVSIATQYINAAFAQPDVTPLAEILLIIYTLLAVEAVGFVLVALGAKRMKKIEEI